MFKSCFKRCLGFVFLLTLSTTSLLATSFSAEVEDSRPIKRVRQTRGEIHYSIKNLPDEIYYRIFSYLEPLDLARIALVSLHFNKLSNKDLVWKPVYKSVLERGSRLKTMICKQDGMQEEIEMPAKPLKILVKRLIEQEERHNPWLIKFYNDTPIPLLVNPIIALLDEDAYGYNSARSIRYYFSIKPKEIITVRAADWDQDEEVGDAEYTYPYAGSEITFEEYRKSPKFGMDKLNYGMNIKALFRGEKGYLKEIDMEPIRNSISMGRYLIIDDVLINKLLTIEDTSPIKSIYRFYLSKSQRSISKNGIEKKINWILCVQPKNTHEFIYGPLDLKPTKRSHINSSVAALISI